MNSYNRSLPALAFWNSRVIIRLLAGTSSCHGKGSEGMWMLRVFLLSVPETLSIICPEGQQGERKALKGSTEFKAQHANHQGSPKMTRPPPSRSAPTLHPPGCTVAHCRATHLGTAPSRKPLHPTYFWPPVN